MRVGDGAQPKKNLNFLWWEIHAQPFLSGSSYFLSYKQRPHFYVSRNQILLSFKFSFPQRQEKELTFSSETFCFIPPEFNPFRQKDTKCNPIDFAVPCTRLLTKQPSRKCLYSTINLCVSGEKVIATKTQLLNMKVLNQFLGVFRGESVLGRLIFEEVFIFKLCFLLQTCVFLARKNSLRL